MNNRITVNISDDGKFNVKFTLPDIPEQEKREEFLRGIGGILVQIFNKRMLPGIAQSFANTDADGKFLCRFIEAVLLLKNIADKNIINNVPDAPLVPPSTVFQHQGD